MPARCPECGGETVRRIVYGVPGPDLMTAQVRGEVILGGCVISSRAPLWRCTPCRQSGGRLRPTGDSE